MSIALDWKCVSTILFDLNSIIALPSEVTFLANSILEADFVGFSFLVDWNKTWKSLLEINIAKQSSVTLMTEILNIRFVI